MVESAIVVFYAKDKGFGHLRVTDEQGNPTGEIIKFGARSSAYPELDTEWLQLTIGDKQERGCQRLRKPRARDRVVFLRDHSSERPRAAAWTYLELWTADWQQLAATKFKWRLVAVADTYYVHQDEPGGISDVCTRSTDAGTIRKGEALLSEINAWRTGRDLDFWYDDGVQSCGNEDIYYELRVLIDGKPHTVRTITPYSPYQDADECNEFEEPGDELEESDEPGDEQEEPSEDPEADDMAESEDHDDSTESSRWSSGVLRSLRVHLGRLTDLRWTR